MRSLPSSLEHSACEKTRNPTNIVTGLDVARVVRTEEGHFSEDIQRSAALSSGQWAVGTR